MNHTGYKCYMEKSSIATCRVKPLVLTGLLVLALISAYSVVPVKAWTGTVYIRTDGRIDPSSAPILRVGDLYTLTDNISSSNGGIVIQRSNIVVDGAGHTVQGTGASGSVGIELSSNVTIKNMKIRAFYYGVKIDSSSRNRILGNNITDNFFGINIIYSSSNRISGNNITNNKNTAIGLDHSSYNNITGNSIINNGYWSVNLQLSSSYNIISGNNITNNDKFGIHLNLASSNVIIGNNITGAQYGIYVEASSSSNTISGNNIRNCKYSGIYIWMSSNSNKIYHNNILENSVYAGGVVNVWDDGYPSGGNYWSDYKGTDLYSGPNQNLAGSDGIGDTPRIISANNTDRYPLMWPWRPTPPSKRSAYISTVSSASTFQLNDEVMLTTNITPSTSNGTVTFQCSKDGGDWTSLASGKPSNGKYSSKWTPSAVASKYQVRAVWSGDEVYISATSTALVFNHLTVSSAYGTPKGDSWYLNGSKAEFSVTPSTVDYGNGTRRIFTAWSGDSTSTSAKTELTMDKPYSMKANWKKQYYLKVSSGYGEPKGEAWYDEGATASFSVTSPVGILIQQVLVGWSGDSTATTATAGLTINSPKAVTAKWTTDYTQLIALVAGIAVVGGATTFVLRRKKR